MKQMKLKMDKAKDPASIYDVVPEANKDADKDTLNSSREDDDEVEGKDKNQHTGSLGTEESDTEDVYHNRKQFKLVDTPFPETMVKAQGVNRLRWDFIIIFLAIY